MESPTSLDDGILEEKRYGFLKRAKETAIDEELATKKLRVTSPYSLIESNSIRSITPSPVTWSKRPAELQTPTIHQVNRFSRTLFLYEQQMKIN